MSVSKKRSATGNEVLNYVATSSSQFETQLFEMLLRKYNVLCYTEAKLWNTKLRKKPVPTSNDLKKDLKKEKSFTSNNFTNSKSTLFIQSV